jgi:hypothetical protein
VLFRLTRLAWMVPLTWPPIVNSSATMSPSVRLQRSRRLRRIPRSRPDQEWSGPRGTQRDWDVR